MGTGYIIDTSGYSRYLDDMLSVENSDFMDSVLEDAPAMCFVVKIELRSFQGDKNKENTIADLVNNCLIMELSDEIIEKTIELRRKAKIKLPDAIIAATAIVHNLTLLSTNDSDFVKVPKLKYKSLNT
ncbi:type II toxin-antitoxin system VapC family toxin [Runella salmonicolor]|jgi:predicted nucleic acid-binding protein|uniref:Type II toxin-antitoxin system VapC family toxin n=1 Tax=Runella salmonicolor TaxID=2950278 RepID=A0ABT1FTG9_9BACT|nr:type II toxin-antitoxin system VapC family toxin [Runella salmonicolor]MCP1385016.1 type II toxin-antitoxin system VapC family toxin [Runella salmonicolor]